MKTATALCGVSLLFGCVSGTCAHDRAWYSALTISKEHSLIGKQQSEAEKMRNEKSEKERERDLKRKIIEDLKKETGGLYEKPNTKDRRRRDLLVKLQQRRNTVMKGGDLIQWTNLCGSELTRQGKGSHCSHDTVTQDGAVQKYGVNSRMKNRHFLRRIEMAEPGMIAEQDESETISKNEEITEKERALQESMEQMREIEGELREYDVSLHDLDAEIERLEERLREKEDTLPELVEAAMFETCVRDTYNHIIHRGFGRPHLIWDIYDAVMTDLHYGRDKDFREQVRKKMIDRKSDWGVGAGPICGLKVCPTDIEYRKILYSDSLSKLVCEQGLPHGISVLRLIGHSTSTLYALGIRGTKETPLILGNRFTSARIRLRGPKYETVMPDDYHAIVDQTRMEDGPDILDEWRYDPALDLMDKLVSNHPSSKGREAKYEQVFEKTKLNFWDSDVYSLCEKGDCDVRYTEMREICVQSESDITVAAWIDAFCVACIDFQSGDDESAMDLLHRLDQNEQYQNLLCPNRDQVGRRCILRSSQRIQEMREESREWRKDSAMELIRRMGRELCGMWNLHDRETPDQIAQMMEYYECTGQTNLALLEWAKIEDCNGLNGGFKKTVKSFRSKMSSEDLKRAKKGWDRTKSGMDLSELGKRKMRVIKNWESAQKAMDQKYDPKMSEVILSEYDSQIREWKQAGMGDSHPIWMKELMEKRDVFSNWVNRQIRAKQAHKKQGKSKKGKKKH